MWQLPASLEQQLECVVDARGVGLVRGFDNRRQSVDIVAERLVLEVVLACPHPVDVALDGVEFAVVDDVPVGVGEMPRPERVRREPRVDECELRADPGVGQVGVVRRQLARGEQPLVHDRLSVQRDDVALFALDATVACSALDGPAREIQPSVERRRVDLVGRPDEQLHDDGFGAAGGLADAGLTRRDRSPGDRLESLLRECLLDELDELGPDRLILGQKQAPDGVLAGRRQRRVHHR